jgi:large subunit ribosomal protein L36e
MWDSLLRALHPRHHPAAPSSLLACHRRHFASAVRAVQGIGERTKQVRSLIREVAGWAPYEKRIMEILKGGGNNPTKRAWRFAKRRLGTHIRAKRKVAEMDRVIGEVKKQEAQAKSAAAAAKAAKEAK